ncbi:MAG: hypothetical protein UY72_C0013G0006 [Candidatus Uhrbacteria bacterium GW2011_GWD2_52_7]|uniref:Uncharacterized protein n=1 Tax=Candidatus Uhrbacteria bacterium GW2011_GWD2_52_7 TaxID=1618989 RepID=A0A0G1XHG3_9BACT|nr:MAG: hypothetical protein UY72_C0013G0006 [Candidatus Uhrbacteria bacterium GW2011_GWD2_52_7]
MRITPSLAAAALVLGSVLPSFAQAATAGDLIKCEDFSAVYYLADDGKRYVFPNENMYFSWFPDFRDVVTISCDNLAALPIGGTAVYQAGTRLVKIPSVPTVFAVEPNGVLRAIASEEQARELFGDDWAKRVDDVPEGFWPSFTQGTELEDGELPEGMILTQDDDIFRINNEGEAEEIDVILEPDQEEVLTEHARDLDEIERMTGVALALIHVDAEQARAILAEVLEKLNTVDVDDEDEIDVDDIDEIEDENDQKEDAEDAIHDATEELERAQDEVNEASEEGRDVTTAQEGIALAQHHLENAENSFTSGDYTLAEEHADEAKHEAMHARGKYISDLDEDEDGVEDEDESEDEQEDEDEREQEDESEDSEDDSSMDDGDDMSDDDTEAEDETNDSEDTNNSNESDDE